MVVWVMVIAAKFISTVVHWLSSGGVEKNEDKEN